MATLRSLVLASYVPVSEEPIASALAVRETAPGGAPKPRLLDRVREAASTQNQALSALLFLYREVLGQDLPWLDDVVRAKGAQRLPVVLTRAEVRAVIQQLEGTPRLMALLMYGAGLRLLECARLRVQDLDFSSNQILVRAGKGNKDRVTMLPAATKGDLARHLERPGHRASDGRDGYPRSGQRGGTRGNVIGKRVPCKAIRERRLDGALVSPGEARSLRPVVEFHRH